MTGTIQNIAGTPLGGIALVVFADGKEVPIEAGFGLRQLYEATDDEPIGETINYETDDYGIMSYVEYAGEEE